MQAASEAYDMAKYNLRQHQADSNESAADAVGKVVTIKELDDVLVKDVGKAVAQKGGNVVIIDVSKRAAVFFRCDSESCVIASRLLPQ